MVLFFSSKMHLISRQVLLSCKQLAVRRCVTTIVGHNQNTSLKQNCCLIRRLSFSSTLHDVKPLANKTVQRDDETSPAEILANLSPEDEKRLKVLKLEYDVFMSTGVRVPDQVNDEDWVHLLLNCTSSKARERYYRYLFKREKTEESHRHARAANRLAMEERHKLYQQMKQEGNISFLNRIHLHVRESTMNHWYNNNLCYALMNGPRLVFDCSFEDQMNEEELTNLIRQLQMCHGDNKVDQEPFHFHFCNLSPNSRTTKKLDLAIANLSEVPYTITDQHYLQCYDRSRIVYLSPNSPTCMTTYDPDDVYVVGCIVDKSHQKPLTFARAKEEKIRCVRFPLDQHIRWVQGSKNLTLNHVLNILLTLKKTNDWEQALVRNLPKRKYTTD